MNDSFPAGTVPVVFLKELAATDGRALPADGLSSRMTRCAAVLPAEEFIGWQMDIAPGAGASFSLFGSGSVEADDLKWISEKAGYPGNGGRPCTISPEDEVYELCLPAAEAPLSRSVAGFAGQPSPASGDGLPGWPLGVSCPWTEIPEAMRPTGGTLRVTVGAATRAEAAACSQCVSGTFPAGAGDCASYTGTPVSVRVLLRLPHSPSLRLRAALEGAVRGTRLRRLGRFSSGARPVWDHPLDGAPVLPEFAARLLILEPAVTGPGAGIVCRRPDPPLLPLESAKRISGRAVTVGTAVDASGSPRQVSIDDWDLRRHYQIIGQTGTGKSTLLASAIVSAITRGYGLTFFDPHGSTIDTVLRSVPKEHAHRIRVVRLGDSAAPVPLSVWDSDDPQKEERNISDLCQLFGSLFDPPGECFTGPRYERWLGTFARASIALLGRRASLESIAVLSQSRANMDKLADAISARYPELAETIRNEYVRDHSSEFNAALSWYLCKFQRLTSVEQLRLTMGAGTNALDLAHTIDTDTVTLIDLSVPAIGTQAARIAGTILLMKLWNAALGRQDRQRTHLVVLDEASLFQTEPLPRMLAESRKFGLAMILCHQHTGQLSSAVREALEANSAGFSTFRLSPRDAVSAALRLDGPELQTLLPRLPAFRAVTSLSLDGAQTPPFTLMVRRPVRRKDGDAVAAAIEAESLRTLVEPYRDLRALTPREILSRLDRSAEQLCPISEEDAWLLDPLPEEDEFQPDTIPIDRLNLSIRSYNCLKRAGLQTVQDILDRGTLQGIRNLGPGCIAEIEEQLRKYSPLWSDRSA